MSVRTMNGLWSLVVGVVSLFSLPSQANERIRHFTEPERFLGWSKDGRYAIWHEDIFTLRVGCASEYSYCCDVAAALVLDTRRGTREYYLLDQSINRFVRRYHGDPEWEGFPPFPFECVSTRGQTPADLNANREAFLAVIPESARERYRTMATPAALRALLQGQPLAWAAPSGGLRFAAEVKSKLPILQKWKRGDFLVSRGLHDGNPHVYGAVARFMIQREQQTTATLVVPLSDYDLNERWEGLFTPNWAPDQRHVVLIYSSVENIKRGPFESATAIMPTVGSKIALQTAAGQLTQARGVIGDILYNAGRSILKSESIPLKQLPEQTQVLALEGHEDAAQAIAALLPGGATVLRQSEHTSYHVTIKLGRSAALAAPPPGAAK